MPNDDKIQLNFVSAMFNHFWPILYLYQIVKTLSSQIVQKFKFPDLGLQVNRFFWNDDLHKWQNQCDQICRNFASLWQNFEGLFRFGQIKNLQNAWSTLGKVESLACQITSPFNKRCFWKAIFLILFSKTTQLNVEWGN